MPVGTAEKHLRKSIIHELATQLGKNQCCRCGLEIEEPDDLAIVHVQDWEEDPDLFWALTNIAFSHAGCEAARSGKRQREKKQMSKVEVRVEDPNGNPLPGARYEGDLWVAGKKGSRYQIRVRNKTKKNVLVVVTVDGRNVITGEPGDHHDSGHVLGPKQSWVFKGWRTSDSEVAAFEFGKRKDSYSSQMGTPENVGVIGVAVFEEEEPEPVIKTVKETTYVPMPYPVYPTWPRPSTPWDRPTIWWSTTIGDSSGGISSSSIQLDSVQYSSGGTYSSSGPVSVSCSADGQASRSASVGQTKGLVSQNLGTGFGETVASAVRRTNFERATEDPCEVFVIRYDSMGALRARGIMVRPSERRQETPQAFPKNDGYCQPPPKRKWVPR